MNMQQRRRNARLRAYAQLKRRYPELFTTLGPTLPDASPGGTERRALPTN